MTSGHPEDDFSLLIVAACEEGKKVVSAPPPTCWVAHSLPWCQVLFALPNL